jgi:hypothetical protein
MESCASGDVYEAAIKGTVVATVGSGTYVVGDGVKVLDGAVKPLAAAAQAYDDLSTNTCFGICLTAGTSITEITVTLYGDRFTATT